MHHHQITNHHYYYHKPLSPISQQHHQYNNTTTIYFSHHSPGTFYYHHNAITINNTTTTNQRHQCYPPQVQSTWSCGHFTRTYHSNQQASSRRWTSLLRLSHLTWPPPPLLLLKRRCHSCLRSLSSCLLPASAQLIDINPIFADERARGELHRPRLAERWKIDSSDRSR